MPGVDWFDGLKRGLLLGAAVLVLAIPALPLLPLAMLAPGTTAVSAAGVAPANAGTALPGARRRLDLAGQPASADLRRLASWVVESADNGRRPFAIVDKKEARVLVFEPGGRLLGSSAVLLGYAPGDDNVLGIGNRLIADVRPEERTTPAGRFLVEPGRNALGEQVIWVDDDAAVSMHRVRLSNPAEQRQARLASPRVADRRISDGCINLPVAFFESVLWPNLGAQRGVVYVLPEVKPLGQVFPAVG